MCQTYWSHNRRLHRRIPSWAFIIIPPPPQAIKGGGRLLEVLLQPNLEQVGRHGIGVKYGSFESNNARISLYWAFYYAVFFKTISHSWQKYRLDSRNGIIIRNNANRPDVRLLGWLFYLMNSTPLVARLLLVRSTAVIGLPVLCIIVFFVDNMSAPSWQSSGGGTDLIELAGIQVLYPFTNSFPVHSIMLGSSIDAARLSELCHLHFLFDGIFCLHGVKLT